nr:hypothetical protein [Tanacetum cinerariifolium]
MKFVSNGEEHQRYGMSILDIMRNDEIRRSESYLTYLTVSTKNEATASKVRKGKGKWVMGKKRPEKLLNWEKLLVLQKQNKNKKNVVCMKHTQVNSFMKNMILKKRQMKMNSSSDSDIKTEDISNDKEIKDNEEKDNEEMKDLENDESEKVKEEHVEEEEKDDDEQAGTNQAGDEEPLVD